MKIETKFEVGQIVKFHIGRGEERYIYLLEVKEIMTITCYTGTQIFYLCRAVILEKKRRLEKDVLSKEYWICNHGIGENEGEAGWKKYREDELAIPEKKYLDILRGLKTNND